jgi:type VI protein secretion system component Hcp
MADEPGGWIAFEVLKGLTPSNNFWLETENQTTGILTHHDYDYENSVNGVALPAAWEYTSAFPAADGDGKALNAQPLDVNFSPISSMKTKVERDYAGINSSGGPQVAGRADHDEILVTRVADKLSPILYQFVSTGEAFSRIIIVLRDAGSSGPRVEWLLHGVNLTEYSFEGAHYFSSSLVYEPQGGALSASTEITSSAPKKYRRQETFRLLYTTAQMRVGVDQPSDWRGWDTGKNDRITDHPQDPSAPASSSSSSP